MGKKNEAPSDTGLETGGEKLEKGTEAPIERKEPEKAQETSAREEEPEKGQEKPAGKKYTISCHNPINESFGGVSFSNGVAYTDDSFTASWFRNKEGYTVKG